MAKRQRKGKRAREKPQVFPDHSHMRKPPMNAPALAPSRAPEGIAFSYLTVPPPSTT
jgi:hypothetical protein